MKSQEQYLIIEPRSYWVAQAYLKNMRAWVTITSPQDDLGNLHYTCLDFLKNIQGVPTRIRKITQPSRTMEEYKSMVQANLNIFYRPPAKQEAGQDEY